MTSLLVVVNTTTAARSVYNAIDVQCRKIFLTTKLCKAHRSRLIEEIQTMTLQGQKLVVVSTQLIEAGVDLSFECVIRDFAGIDNLAQASGRCNRNGEFNKPCDVFFQKLKYENLKYLKEIEEARQATKGLFAAGKNHDFLSNEAIDEYYERLFRCSDDGLDKLDYIIDIPKRTTLMSLLSDNKTYLNDFRVLHNGEKPPILCQSFKTAGENFRVIDNATHTIIVPYADGKKYIEFLTGGAHVKEKMRILKKCCSYTVNAFEWEVKCLQEHNAICFIDSIGIWLLMEEYYSEEYGLITESKLNFLNI